MQDKKFTEITELIADSLYEVDQDEKIEIIDEIKEKCEMFAPTELDFKNLLEKIKEYLIAEQDDLMIETNQIEELMKEIRG